MLCSHTPIDGVFSSRCITGYREEERALFGDITDNDDDGDTEDDSPSDDDDNYFDEYNGMCEVLQNDAH